MNALAKAANASRSATGERLRQLGRRGTIEKDSIGRWKLKGEEAREPGPTAGRPHAGAPVDLTAAPDPATQLRDDRSDAPPAAAPSRWIRPARRVWTAQPHEFQMSRFG